jgi:8-oxo-dGTP diphosphatase
MTEPDAAVAVIQAHEPRRSILLIRRAEREGDSWSGHWSFPGGWRHSADPDLLAAAIREMAEECGVQLARDQMERPLPHTIARRKVGRFVKVAPFLFRVDREFATVLNPREAADAIWVPISLLLDRDRHALRPAPGRPPEMLFPSVELNGPPLWGFTYRLITDWLGLGAQVQPIEKAGLEVADLVLDFVLSQGLPLSQSWTDRTDGAKTCTVTGAIPVDAVLAHFSAPEHCDPAINCLEVHASHIRVSGPAWEDYFIYAQA